MTPTRREILAAGLATVIGPGVGFAREPGPVPLGLVIHSFPARSAGDRDRRPEDRFAEPIRFLDHARSLGAGGIQVGIGARDDAYADKLRARAEEASMGLEGIASLPRDEGDVPRFEAEIRTARRAGATIVRTVMLSGRRYENFDSLAAFREFADRSTRSLTLATPVVVRHGVRLAVENHKDWRADELIGLLKRLGSDHVGVCVDTGNSMALLEDPMEVVEALAPWAVTTHLKDMGVEEYDRGFRIAEVPLGAGVLDLPRIVRTLRSARPGIPLNLEMITRDPLDVPCLDDRYWATFPDLAGRHLARSLSFVRNHPAGHPLPRIGQLGPDERLKVEDENIRRCLDYAREHF
ncbi:sugar phosphate isomerase/epimerase family protein [Tundrisphaera lichenicola]|uniref:sugar phosphate isomerase/epimerase family protein n=1 Tax=Tundrisphaera lichenicola TaxID=2029860 RepID=UPI003EBDFAEC